MRKNRIILGVLVVSILVVFIFSSAKPTQASYSNTIIIDNIQEPEYEKIMDMDNYEIWYANNNTHHFLYIITPFIFTTETVTLSNQDDEFHYTFSPTFPINNKILSTRFENNTLELRVKRELIGNNFVIEIKTYQFVLSVNPKSSTNIPITHSEKTEEKIIKQELSPYGFLVRFWTNWLNVLIFFLILTPLLTLSSLQLYRFTQTCKVRYKNLSGKNEYIGRIIHEEKSNDILGYHELYFKDKGLRKVYSKVPYINKLTPAYWEIPFYKMYADIVYREVDAKLIGIILYEKEPEDGFYNKLKYYTYLILSRIIPGVFFIRRLKNDVNYKVKTEKEDDLTRPKRKLLNKEIKGYYQKDKLDDSGKPIPVIMKKIPIAQHQLSFDRINHVCDVEYDIMETSEKGETKVHKIEKDKSLYYVNDLKRNEKVIRDSIIETNFRKEVITDYNMEKAILEQDSINNVRSIADLKVAKITQDFIELDKKYNLTREQLDDVNRHIDSIVKEKMINRFQKSVIDEDLLSELISIAITGYKESADVKEASLQAFREYYNKKGAHQIGDYKSKFEIEQAKAKVYEKQVKQLQNKDNFLLSGKIDLDTDLEVD